MVPVMDLDAGAGRDNVTRNLASGPVFDYQVCPVYSRVDLCPVTFVCAKWQRVDVAMELDCVVLDDGIFVAGRPCQHWNIRLKILAFVAPLLIRDFARGAVGHGIPCPAQPCFRFGIEVVNGAELPVEKEVLFDILDGILNLALALRVGRTAENNIKRTALHIALEDCRHPIVTDVLVIKEDRILVVDDEAGYTAEVL